MCPEPITVPIGVEAVWALITPRLSAANSQFNHIAVCSIYYRGPKSTCKDDLFDHIGETYNYLMGKYGSKLHFIIAGDTNRLNLKPILNLSPRFKQVVKVPTRLNPDAILDPIITTLSEFYQEPVTKPPIQNDADKSGKPSDHLVVLMEPISSQLNCPRRQYRTVTFRPLPGSGIEAMEKWLSKETWIGLYSISDVDKKAEFFQNTLLEKLDLFFPLKTVHLSDDDQPWVSAKVKKLDRKRKREFFKDHKSRKWNFLNEASEKMCKAEKESYYENIVHDLKTSKPGEWYSKIKRMTGQTKNCSEKINVEELVGLTDKEQAEKIADHYAKISNSYEPVNSENFQKFFKTPFSLKFEAEKIKNITRSMNKKAATIKDDIPMKLINIFAEELSFPLTHIINATLRGQYPNLWKHEIITPVPKIFPPEKLKDLRKISGLLNFSKIAEKAIGELIIQDMKPTRDLSQFGNEKNLSIQHYLIQMLHTILKALDQKETAVILQLIDWSQAFDRQNHNLGIKSFIDNGVRPSLIPVLTSYFKERKITVKWNKQISSTRHLNGGGPQGGLMGILEYLSQTDGNLDFVDLDKRFKYIDDVSIIEIISLISIGLTSYNCKNQVPSDIGDHNQFLPAENLQSQNHLNQLCNWTLEKEMKLNAEKSKYMVFNPTKNYQFNTRLRIQDNLLEQVKSTRLLGLVINDNLTWHENTAIVVQKAYKRMIILHNLFNFNLPIIELINIYILYIRSLVEQSAVVWNSSITLEECLEIERVQKVALRLIMRENYVSYANALCITGLPTLKERRDHLCTKFAENCAKSEKSSHMFPLNSGNIFNTRNHETFFVAPARTKRYANSAIPSMQRGLNS